MKSFDCEQCGCEMKQTERLQNTKPSKSNPKGFRIRRFKCSNLACDHQETIFADGLRDKVFEPAASAEEVKKMFKKEKKESIKFNKKLRQ